MKLRQILLILLVIGSVFLTGCNTRSNTQDYVVCNKPYIRMGLDCCLDTNDNSICDADENTNLVKEEITTEEVQENSIKECFIVKSETGEKKGSGIICEERDDCNILFQFSDYKGRLLDVYFDCQNSELVEVPELKCSNKYNCLGFEDEKQYETNKVMEFDYLYFECVRGICEMTPTMRDLLLEPKQSVTYVPK